MTHRAFGGGLQPVERGAQVVRRTVENRPHAERELFDLVQHAVDLTRQRVDLIVRLAHRQSLRQVAAHDLGGHRRDRPRLRQDSTTHPESATQAHHQGQHHGGHQSTHHQIFDVLALLHVVPHQHPIAAGEGKALRPHLVLAGFIAERHRHLELDPLAFIGGDLRPRGNIARDRAKLRIHHQVHRATHILVLRALFDELDEVPARQHQHLLTQSLDLGLDQVVGAAIDDP